MFRVVHPVWGELKTSLKGACPELAQERKLSEFKEGISLLKAKLDHLLHEEKLPWTSYVRKYLDSGLERDLWKAMQGSFMKELPDSMFC